MIHARQATATVSPFFPYLLFNPPRRDLEPRASCCALCTRQGNQDLVSVLVAEIDTGLSDTLAKGLFTLSNPDSGVVKLLVGLVGAFGVTDLRLEIVLFVDDKVANTLEVGELGVCVDVHLDDTVDDGRADLVLGRTGSTVEDQVPEGARSVSCCVRFLSGTIVFLRFID